MKVIKVASQIPELVEKYKAISNSVATYVIGREAETAALNICLFTGQHLLLEGKPGLAKSRFAILAFKAFEDASVFSTMMHGQSTTDELFGIPNTALMRNEGILRFNTKGMLPEADFAFIDELFNGPAAVLNSTLNVLNERKFMNGGTVQKCPLKTAVCTSNVVNQAEELAAFIDRFLIVRAVKPADSAASRQRVLEAFLAADDVADIELPDTLTLKELSIIKSAIKQVVVPPIFVSMIENIRTSYASNASNYISDRRWCWLYRSIQASLLLATDGKMVSNPPTSALEIVADVLARRASDIETLQATIVQQFSLMTRTIQESEELNQLEERLTKRIRRYDPALSLEKKKGIARKLMGDVTTLQAIPANQQYSSAANVSRFETLIRKVEECVMQAQLDLGVIDRSGNVTNLELFTEISTPESED